MRQFVEIALRLQESPSALPEQLVDRVRTLESRVGAELVGSKDDRVVLTTHGDALAAESLRSLRYAAVAVEAARSTARTSIGTLRIGIAEAAAGPTLLELIRRFNERHPQSPVELVDYSNDEVFAAIEAGRIDVGFTFEGDAGPTIEAHLIEHQDLVAVMAADHPSANAGYLALTDLSRLRMIEYCTLSSGVIAALIGPILADGGLGRIKVDGPRNAILAAAAGLGVALLPSGIAGTVAPEYLRCVPVRASELGVQVVALVPRGASDPLVEDLIGLQRV